jgi:hypothetical protein
MLRIDTHILYILVHKDMDISMVYNGVLSHVYRNRVQLQMITDGVIIGSGRLAKGPRIA